MKDEERQKNVAAVNRFTTCCKVTSPPEKPVTQPVTASMDCINVLVPDRSGSLLPFTSAFC